ncbi:hypothetical protein B0T20DRAFT_136590 [Sordaria brevicollis]|uniref:Nephrocystin 3-like N-terminal domain-containing protein n=1 Tax=Sordaria brevicollis TaxID=83679 RepID=A0AAE0UFN1_SORBR|nr:hypothetical protein B0T20DRAFT_136590 [Sordaria brevicollis]
MSTHNSGPGAMNFPNSQGVQINSSAGGTQYNNNYYGPPPSGSDQERERLELEKQECLRTLSFSSLDSRRNEISVVHLETGDWIFERPEFQDWRDGTNNPAHNRVLWIKGHPGTGKSTIMKHILKYCEEVFKDHIVASYFFHARGDSLQKTPLGLLRSLTFQLLDNHEPSYQRFLPSFRRKKKIQQKLEWVREILDTHTVNSNRTHGPLMPTDI